MGAIGLAGGRPLGQGLLQPCWRHSYTTTFPLTENPISENGNWWNNGLDWAAVATQPGLAYGTQTGSSSPSTNDAYAYLLGFGPDHKCSGHIHIASNIDTTGNHECSFHMRKVDSPHVSTGYECGLAYNGAYGGVTRWDGALNSFTSPAGWQIGTIPGGVHDGDFFEVQIVGNIITMTLRGTVLITVDITTSGGGAVWTQGNPAISMFRHGTNGFLITDIGFTDFTAVTL